MALQMSPATCRHPGVTGLFSGLPEKGGEVDLFREKHASQQSMDHHRGQVWPPENVAWLAHKRLTHYRLMSQRIILTVRRFVLLSSVLLQQRFGVMDIKALGMSQLSGLGHPML